MPTSVVVHLVIVALLIFGLPHLPLEAQDEQPINVDLVPPPKPTEKAKPPPPNPQPKTQKQADAPPPPGDAARKAPSPGVQPVFQFGEKDAGPQKSLDGNSAEDGAKTPAKQPDPNKNELAKPLIAKANEGEKQAPQEKKAEIPASKSADVALVKPAPRLAKARTLFSRSVTDDPAATTAMGKIPRDRRGGSLCYTELHEQLKHASPPYFPDNLPLSRLSKGTVIYEPDVAFHVGGQWRALSFRCEVDANAMKVVSFAFNVGNLIPRSEWNRRGLPSQ